MKRLLSVVLVLVFMAGCSAAPVAAPIPAASASLQATVVPSPSPTPTLFAEPSANGIPTPSFEPSPTPESTDTPLDNAPLIYYAFPPLADKALVPSLDIGIMSISQGNFLYYIDDDDITIYKQDLGTGKRNKLLVAQDTVHQIFLDAEGNLFYVCYDPQDESVSDLYEYQNQQDVLIAKYIIEVDRVDASYIYYTAYKDYNPDSQNYDINVVMRYGLQDGNTTRVAQFPYEVAHFEEGNATFIRSRPLMFFTGESDESVSQQLYSMDLTDGSVCLILSNKKYLFTDDGDTLVIYVPGENETSFTLYNYKTWTKSSFSIPKRIDWIDHALVTNNRLYLIDSNTDPNSAIGTRSDFYTIDVGTAMIISKAVFDLVSDTSFYNGNWFFYSCVWKKHRDSGVYYLDRQTIRMFDPSTGKFTVLAILDPADINIDESFTFEVSGNMVWAIDATEYAYGGYFYCIKKVRIPKG